MRGRVVARYLTKVAAYDDSTLSKVMAGIGMLMAQSVIVTSPMFSEAEVRKYLKLRQSYHEEFVESVEDLAEALEEGRFGEAAKTAVRPLQAVGAIPVKQAQRALRMTSRALRGLKRIKRNSAEVDPRLLRLIYVAERLDPSFETEYRRPQEEYELLIKDLLRIQEVPAPVRTLLRKALKLAREAPTDTSNAGAWFEMDPSLKNKLRDLYGDLGAQMDAAYDQYKDDPEKRQEVYRKLMQRRRRVLDVAGVNREILQRGHQEDRVPLEKLLKREAKLQVDGPTEYVQVQLQRRLKEAAPSDYKGPGLPRELRKVFTQIGNAKTFDTMKRVIDDAVEAKVLYSEWADTLSNIITKTGKNLALKKNGTLTPIQWEPKTIEEFKTQHSTGDVIFDEETPEPQRQEILGRVSRALDDLEGIFGKGFAGKHGKPLRFEFTGAGGMASASYFGWDDRSNWKPRVRFGEDFDGLLAHELSHFFDDLLATKIAQTQSPDKPVTPGVHDLFGSTGVDLEYLANNDRWMDQLSKVIPELAEFAKAVVGTEDFQRWKDMTSNAHEIGINRAIKNLTGKPVYELDRDHPYRKINDNPPRFRSEWPPELLEATEHAYAQDIMDGDSRKLRYYQSGVEVWARMVEQYVYTRLADAGIANPWLTQLTYDTDELPQMMEQETFEKVVAPILDRLFARVKQQDILETTYSYDRR